MGSVDDLVTNLKGGVTNVGQAVAALNGISTAVYSSVAESVLVVAALNAISTAISNTFPRVSGTFTLSAATTTNVTQTGINANGFPQWTPTNLTAALTLINHGLYLSAVTAGAGFSVSTGTGVAAGTETFSYTVFNPS